MSEMTPEQDREFLRMVGELGETSRNGHNADGPGSRLVTRASQISSRTVKWAWTGRLALGYLTIQTGEEGLGKSVFDAWLAAGMTHGAFEGVWRDKPVDVLVVAGEDGLEDTWKPRLTVARADLDRVSFVNLDELPVDWDVRDGIDALRTAVIQSDAKLVVFDALLDHMPTTHGGENINSPTFVRGALKPLRDLVKDLSIVGLISMHPPKSRGASFRDLVQASQAFGAVPRIGLYFGWHPDDAEDDPDRRRVIVRGKGNIGRNPGALEFRVTGKDHVHDDGEMQEREVVCDVRASDLTLSDLLSRPGNVDRDGAAKPDQAAQIMLEHLADGEWHPCAPIRAELEARDLNHNQIVQRAKRLADVESRKASGSVGGEWEWRLPRVGRPEEESQEALKTPPCDSSEPEPLKPLQIAKSHKSHTSFTEVVPGCGHTDRMWRPRGASAWTCELCHPPLGLDQATIEWVPGAARQQATGRQEASSGSATP